MWAAKWCLFRLGISVLKHPEAGWHICVSNLTWSVLVKILARHLFIICEWPGQFSAMFINIFVITTIWAPYGYSGRISSKILSAILKLYCPFTKKLYLKKLIKERIDFEQDLISYFEMKLSIHQKIHLWKLIKERMTLSKT